MQATFCPQSCQLTIRAQGGHQVRQPHMRDSASAWKGDSTLTNPSIYRSAFFQCPAQWLRIVKAIDISLEGG